MADSITRALSFGPLLTAITGGLLLCPCRAIAVDQGPTVLENAQLRLEVDPGNGAIARIVDKQGQIHLVPVTGMADNFRLTLRGAGRSDKVILGRRQRLAALSRTDNGLDLAWNGRLIDSEGGEHSLRVRMEIRLVGPSLEFRLRVQNDTPRQVTEAWYPLVGGLTGFGRGPSRGETWVMLPTASPTIKKVVIPFDDRAIEYPGQMNMSYSDVYNIKANRAMYFASHDTVARLKRYRFLEQSSPAGKDVFACIQHVPMTPPGKTFEGSPVIVRFHDGTWPAAGPIYREWFSKAFGIMGPSRSWIRRSSFVQDTMFLLPEGTINCTFKDIPRWAKEARDHGITAVLISGWHRGGHDNGYPHYDPDPRLGTYDDLRLGLEACHKMGVRVYFFVNYQPAMIESDWFKQELHRYVQMREDGGYGACGWGMGTLWARMGNAKPMAGLDPMFPEYREALLRRFLKLVEVGADGLHVDKMFPGPMDFNPRCELGPDTSPWEGPIQLTRILMERAKKINPDFAMSFECNWDRMLEFGDAIWWVGNMSLARSVFPEMVETRGITSPYDYLGVNNAVRLSQAGLLGPLNYTRSVGWEPWQGLAAYIREVKRVQDDLSEIVFLGEVLGHAEIELGHEPKPGVEYSVFRGLKTGKHACILTNCGMEDEGQAIRTFSGSAGGCVRIHVPFAPPRDATLPVTVVVPAERVVFVEERSTAGAPACRPTPPDAKATPLSRAGRAIENGGFETGDFTGWIAEPNWQVDRNTCGEYRGWEGRFFAWSGGRGEAATGRLKSKPFVLDGDAVRLLIAGWNTAPGSNRSWNYVMLKTADGTEIDRQSPLNSLTFAPAILDGSGHRGERVYIEAVDDADREGFSMFCIDDVRTLPPSSGHEVPLAPPAFDDKASIKLENDRYRVEVSRAHGSVMRIFDKIGKLELIREPRLADNFTFTLPLPGKEPWETIEANYVAGKGQPLSSFDVQGQKLTLRWRGPLTSRRCDKYDVAALMRIELEGQAVCFRFEIENHSPCKIGEVCFPILGGVTGLGSTRRQLKTTRLVRPSASGAASSDIFFQFTNFSGLGDQGPEQFFLHSKDWPETWIELYQPRLHRSLCFGSHGRADRPQAFHLEMLPGNAETPRWDGNWPRPEELNGLPAGVLISFVEFANHPPGKTYVAAPVVLQFHEGDWQEGKQVFQKWNTSR